MYNNNHDCPFEAYITNLGKYNEGELMGEWVKFPTTAEEMQEIFRRIGIDGVRYEEWFITDYDCYVDGIYDVLGEYESLDELNYLASKLEDMTNREIEIYEAALDVGDYSSSLKDLINLTENLDCYDYAEGITDDSDLGYYYVEDAGIYDTKAMGSLANYIDYERFGRDVRLDEGGCFAGNGYIRNNGDSFTELYDGSREDIPWEYRVTATPEEQEFLDEQEGELSEDEKLEQAQEQKDTMTVLVVEPMKEPYIKELPPGLSAMQQEVGGLIAAAYPFNDPVAVICNDEGKINGMELNRALRDDRGEIYDIVAGPFLVTGLGEENFASLSPELVEKYMEHFKTPEMFAMVDGELVAIPIPADEYRTMPAPEVEPAALDDFLTGEKIKTPRGSFSLTDMTREQMEAAGYGYHHGSDDGRYHIMGNGTRAFAIINENARTYDIYQLKDFSDRRDYAFEPLDRLHEQGRQVDMQNYDKVYSGAMLPGENLESIYTRFNIDHPEDFTGHSLSVSDVVVIRQNGQDTAHYCDSLGFAEVPEFLQPENYLKNAEMGMEDDYGMIDGIINNGEKEVTPPGTDEKTSIRDRLAEAKRECAERKPPEVKKPEKNGPEHDL